MAQQHAGSGSHAQGAAGTAEKSGEHSGTGKIPAISRMTAKRHRRPGGQHNHGSSGAGASSGSQGSFAKDHEKAAEAGRKGGQH